VIEFWVLSYCTPWPVREVAEAYYRSEFGATSELQALHRCGWDASVTKLDVPMPLALNT